MNELPTLGNAWLAVEDGKVAAYGSMDDWPGISDWADLEVIDASGKIVLPAWCDSHTHLVYAGNREQEFVDRINGLTYEEIAARGGGILNSAAKLQEASEDELFEAAMSRLKEVISKGTGAIEIKSGYGLTLDAELKMLRVARRIGEEGGIPVKTTFLGAHAVPKEYADDRTGYVDHVINDMLPKVVEEGLADYIDTFCETNYFTVEDTVRIMKAGAEAGLPSKIHVNQFTSIGGVKACVDHGAVSIDHLEELSDDDLAALSGSDTICTALPSCSFFLSIPYTPADKLISNGNAVALATDFNPGSSPSGNMNHVLSLACIKMKMTVEQAINAMTINGAYAMGLGEEMGSICPGKRANLIITKEVPSLGFLPYYFGDDLIERVIINGE